jgi:hypothetical protein
VSLGRPGCARRIATLGLAAVLALPGSALADDAAATPDSPLADDAGAAPESWWAVDEAGRRFRVAFDPGNRWMLGGGYAAGHPAGAGWAGPAAGQVETGLFVRHAVVFPEEQVAWKMYHDVLMGRVWLGDASESPVPLLDATLYRGTYLRWQREGYVMLPTTPPRRLRFPLNIGLDAVVGRFETMPEGTGLAARIEAVRSHFLLDAWRSREMGLYAQFGIGPAYDLWLAGSFVDAAGVDVEHLVSPGSDLTATVRFETGDGRHAVEGRGSCGWWWSSARGWGVRAEAAASYEFIWLALNDQPLSGYVEAAYRYEQLLEPRAAHDFRATAGLRFSVPLVQ